MVRHYELSDEAFGLFEDLLPPNGRRGGQWNDHRTTLNGIFWILHTGAQWRELATRFEKLAVNFLAMVKLAMIQRCLRVLHSPDRA